MLVAHQESIQAGKSYFLTAKPQRARVMNEGQQICGRRGRGLAAVRKRRLPSSWVIWTASQPRVLTRYLREAAHSGGRSGTLVGDLGEQARGEHRQHVLHLLWADKGG